MPEARDEMLIAWLMTTLLLVVRLGVAVGLSPALASYGVPGLVRLLLVFAMSVLIASAGGSTDIAFELARSEARLVSAVAAEVVVGMLLGLCIHVVLAAFAMAGRLLDVQIGFGIGSIFDPVTRSGSNVVGALMSLLGVCLFFVTDAHVAVARMVAQSLAVLPLGYWPDLADPMRPLTAVGAVFSLGFALVAPVVVALLLTDTVVGLASRNLPQVNVLVLAVPIKVIVGYAMLAFSVRAWAPLVSQAFGMLGDVLGAKR